MPTSTSEPLVFFHMLADRHGRPAGLLFDAPGATLLPESMGGDALHALGAHLPGFFPPDLAPELAAALGETGWRALDPAAVHVAPTELSKSLPPAIQWVRGDWCMAPPAKPVGSQAASRTLALQLVQLVSVDADTHEIEAMLRRDPTLSYHLLRLVNSLGMGVGRRITSFSQAILILGRQQLRRWLNLMLFAAREGDVRSAMLLARVAVRARAIEQLCKEMGQDKAMQEQGFMTGMFSLLGVLFGLPLAEILQPLMISDDVRNALLAGEGDLGALLKLVVHAENGQFDALAADLAKLQLDPAQFNRVAVDAYSWMLEVVRETRGGAHA